MRIAPRDVGIIALNITSIQAIVSLLLALLVTVFPVHSALAITVTQEFCVQITDVPLDSDLPKQDIIRIGRV